MPDTVPSGARDLAAPRSDEALLAHTRNDRWSRLAAATIIVLGSPRSGTSWLAKIFDSHPNTLYRHEPDELVASSPGLDPAAQVALWLLQRGLRAAAKRPNFRKSWRPSPLETVRRGFASVLAAAQRAPLVSHVARRITLPDLIPPSAWQSVRAVIKLVNWDGAAIVRAMPDMRCVFIIRHPCGQIASVLAGLAARRFGDAEEATPAGLMKAAAFAAENGIDAAGFAGLPDAAKYAWSWLAFNEPAVADLQSLSNARIVVYEDLCRQPEMLARELFAFAGLEWHRNTTAFLASSTRDSRDTGYYDVFRATDQVADRWRDTMSEADQATVRGVVAMSPLARYWSDLAPIVA